MRPPLWFWRTSAGEEIDVLVETAPERFVAIESKTSAQVTAADFKALRSLTSEYGEKCLVHALVACRTDRAYPLTQAAPLEAVPLLGRRGLLRRKELGFA
jgi:DNA-binding transcriptional regulator YdaS (Cro superfamily)